MYALQEAEEFKLSIFDESRTSAANTSSSASTAGSEDSGMVQTIVFDQPQGRLYVCLICMPYMYAFYVCLICRPILLPYISALHGSDDGAHYSL